MSIIFRPAFQGGYVGIVSAGAAAAKRASAPRVARAVPEARCGLAARRQAVRRFWRLGCTLP
jgi:hypothetical protein